MITTANLSGKAGQAPNRIFGYQYSWVRSTSCGMEAW